MVKQVLILNIEQGKGGIRERAVLLSNDVIELCKEFRNVDTGEWEFLDSVFLGKEQLNAIKELIWKEIA